MNYHRGACFDADALKPRGLGSEATGTKSPGGTKRHRCTMTAINSARALLMKRRLSSSWVRSHTTQVESPEEVTMVCSSTKRQHGRQGGSAGEERTVFFSGLKAPKMKTTQLT